MPSSMHCFLTSLSDLESELSDPPEDFDKMESSLEAEIEQISLDSPLLMDGSRSCLKRKSTVSSRFEEDWPSDSSELDHYHLSPSKRQKLCDFGAKFEELPTEILNQIASYLVDDHDLVNLISTCSRFANALAPASSAIWKERFLARYDHAYVRRPSEYAIAYQLRRFVLGHFVPFTTPKDKRLAIQLEVLKDMVLETYLQPRPRLAPPLTSRNLAVFASPGNSPWMRTFLSCFFFPKPGRRYGQPHAIFDAIQLVLSHLLISPESKMAHVIDSSRENYNLAIVYNWDKPFGTLFRYLPEDNEGLTSMPDNKPRILASLRDRKSISLAEGPKEKYELDTHALLHIRNFWHRHLIDDSARLVGSRQQMGVMGENTYAKMARDLRSAGISAKLWDKPLKDGLPQMATEWYGHWSCVHPWPKKRQELDEMQSCAEDWENIDPMKLEFSISTNNQLDGFWSPIFSAIPAFAKSISESASSVFIRGLAPFVELPSSCDGKTLASTLSRSQATLTTPRLPKYHPYLALRLRGIIHSIPKQPASMKGVRGLESETDGIPGWNRIAMVLYKPSKRYLIQVLEHAEEEYGGQFGPAVTSQLLLQADQAQAAAAAAAAAAQPQPQPQPQAANPGDGGQPAVEIDASEFEAQLESYLHQKLISNPDWRNPTRMDRETIEDMEEKFRLSEFLDWNDIDYAYAYEGVVLPGGKIMMGRWWRCGMLGQGDGMELGADGQPVDQDPATQAGDVDGQTQFSDVGLEVPSDGTITSSSPSHGVPADSSGTGNNIGHTESTDNKADDHISGTETDLPINNTTDAAGGTNSIRDKKLERGPFVFWC